MPNNTSLRPQETPDAPLVLSVPSDQIDQPTLTVTLETKWYGLWLVVNDGQPPTQISFANLEEFCTGTETAFCDHCPNPEIVVRLAEAHKLDVDPLALELIIGRWELEYYNAPRYRRPGQPA